MSSESKEKYGKDGAVEERVYVDDESRYTDIEHSLHVGNKSYQGLPECHRNSFTVELRSPSPCPGSRSSSADSMNISSQCASQLKDDIIKEIKREVMKPLQVMYSNILDQIHTLKLKSETVRADVSCQTDFTGDNHMIAAGNTNSAAFGGPHSLSGSDTQNFSSGDVENDMSSTDKKKPALSLRKDDQYRKTSTLPRTTPSSNIFRSNSSKTRGQIVQVRPRQKSEVNPTTANLVDKSESLAKALQLHIEEIVDGLAFDESNLLDCLVSEGYLTEDEYILVKNKRDRKDQIRALVSTIKGRDLRVLEGFVKHIKQRIPAVAEKFERSMGTFVPGNSCSLCKLERQFNVKTVVDGLWSIQVIDDGVYNKIYSSVAPVGEQRKLWMEIFNSLNSLNPDLAKLAHMALLKTVSEDQRLTHLEKEIKEVLIKNQGKLICSCEPNINCPNTESDMFSISGQTVFHDSSSTSFGGCSNEQFSKNRGPSGSKNNISEEASKKTAPSNTLSGYDRKDSDNPVKPPPLPKRPSFAKNSAVNNLLPNLPFKATKPSVPSDAPVTSATQVQQGVSLADRSPMNASLRLSMKSKTEREHKTASLSLQGPPTNDNKTIETHDETLSASGIPPLPVKKNKYSAWKRADEQGPSYV